MKTCGTLYLPKPGEREKVGSGYEITNLVFLFDQKSIVSNRLSRNKERLKGGQKNYQHKSLSHASRVHLSGAQACRGILADVIVYIFAHLHTALLAEGNVLDINWLQEVKVLVKLNTCWNIWLFLSNIPKTCVSKTAKSLGSKSANELIHSL